jgi:DNA-binding transcriptional ArsR family regulator
MRTIPSPPVEQLELTAVLDALSDPVRLGIVAQLAEEPEVACGCFEEMPVAKSTLTHHLNVLRQAGLVSTRQEGVRRYQRLRRDELEERFPGLLGAVLSAAARQHV